MKTLTIEYKYSLLASVCSATLHMPQVKKNDDWVM